MARGMLRRQTLCAVVTAVLSIAPTGSQGQILPQEIDGSGSYLTGGMGVLNITKGTGLSLPLGATVFARRYGFIARVAAFDFGLFEKTDPTSRYQRSFGRCVDTQIGVRVSDFRCSGGTEVIRSFTADLSFVPASRIIVAGRQGSLFTGMGVRLRHPRTAYGTLGLFFASRNGRANGARISLGRNFISLNISWSLRMQQLLGRL